VKAPSYTSRRALLNRFVCLGFCAPIPVLTLLRPAAADTPAAGLPPADLSEPEARQVVAVVDGDTLRLDRGEVLRLAGIEAAKRSLAADPAMAALEAEGRDSLAQLVGAGTITLRYDRMRRDRYGRLLAQAFNAAGLWLQAAQVESGAVRIHGDGANRCGLRDLLALEATARNRGLGIWRNRAFAVRDAGDPGLKRLAGSFQIVAGRVVAAALVKDSGYINFGADRRTDLTLVLKRPVLQVMKAEADPTMIDLPSLGGRRIRCRGWLDLHDGPSIEISHPEQIEILE